MVGSQVPVRLQDGPVGRETRFKYLTRTHQMSGKTRRNQRTARLEETKMGLRGDTWDPGPEKGHSWGNGNSEKSLQSS